MPAYPHITTKKTDILNEILNLFFDRSANKTLIQEFINKLSKDSPSNNNNSLDSKDSKDNISSDNNNFDLKDSEDFSSDNNNNLDSDDDFDDNFIPFDPVELSQEIQVKILDIFPGITLSSSRYSDNIISALNYLQQIDNYDPSADNNNTNPIANLKKQYITYFKLDELNPNKESLAEYTLDRQSTFFPSVSSRTLYISPNNSLIEQDLLSQHLLEKKLAQQDKRTNSNESSKTSQSFLFNPTPTTSEIVPVDPVKEEFKKFG